MPRIFDLKTRVEQVQPGSSNPCGVCQRQFAKYTCPACNLQYCSLMCYRAEAHSACTETFYKAALVEEIKSEPARPTEEKQQMLELLKRFEEESIEEEGSDEEDDLALRLEGVDLDKVDHETLWGLLSEEEKQKFTKMLMNPTSEDSQDLLNASRLLENSEDPWWVLDNPLDSTLPMVKQIPSTMLAGKFNPILLFNVFHLSLTYAYTVRTFAASFLSTRVSDELEGIREFMLPLSPFLRDRRSTVTFTSVDSVITDWVSHLPELPNHKLLKLLTEDARRIFHSQPIVVEDDSPSQSSNHDNCMRLLSDLHTLFDGLKKHAHVTHKLTFYLAFLVNLPTSASRELLGAIGAWQVKHQEGEQDTSRIDTIRSRTLIEEI
ncbi:neurogenesis, partial [Rhizoctonia solani]